MSTRTSRSRPIPTLAGLVALVCLVFSAVVSVSSASMIQADHDRVEARNAGHEGGLHPTMASAAPVTAESRWSTNPEPGIRCCDGGSGCQDECAANCASMAGCAPAVAARAVLCPMPTFGAIGYLSARAAGRDDSAGVGPPLRPPIL